MFFLQISPEEINQISLKWQMCQNLKVSARMAGTSITKTAVLFGVARSTISKVMTAFEKGDTSRLKKNWKKAKAI